MPFLVPLLVGTAATTGTAATAGVIGSAGAVTAAGLIGATGAAAGIAAGVTAGRASQFAGDLQGKLAEREAKLQEQKAGERRKAGKAAVDIEKEQLRRNIETLRARRAGAGVTEAGTPLLLELEAVKVGTLDAIQIGRNIEIGAQQAESAAELAKIKGRAAKAEGKLRAGVSLFRTAGTVGSFAAQRLLAA
jgi:hypothetical protein